GSWGVYVVIHYTGLKLTHFGNVLGLGIWNIPPYLDVLVTVFAVVGAINAFNMVDGIDGLLGTLTMVVFTSFSIIFFVHDYLHFAYHCLMLVVILTPFVLLNLECFGKSRKVFIGDAGSMLIGFAVIWVLIGSTQLGGDHSLMRPVTALWLIGVPLIDMVTVMVRRMQKGYSPFGPDREHAHHIMLRIGLSPRESLVLICMIQVAYASVGLLGEYFLIPEYVMFYTILGCFSFHTFCMMYAFKLANIVRKWRRINGKRLTGRVKPRNI
ncbi:undecaprenyl-phosphate alpha-N-acetylglucosaminyl 1-phosphate transferase, partial [Vibrio breoganii]|uniref:undecaprenyl-phosphate alpha-N-acetylglucosaminyl 1-phosphate transferase n=1 Tax=Vibrio breoganii TaxID=553239 RepID=UPI000C82F4EB